MEFMVISTFTENSEYEVYANRLIASGAKLGIKVFAFPHKDKGNWRENLNKKSEAILSVADKNPGKSILFLDADTRILKCPEIFDDKDFIKNYDVSGVRNKAGNVDTAFVWISGGEESVNFISEWHRVGLDVTPDVRHQACFNMVLDNWIDKGLIRFHCLPGEYLMSGKANKETIVLHEQHTLKSGMWEN